MLTSATRLLARHLPDALRWAHAVAQAPGALASRLEPTEALLERQFRDKTGGTLDLAHPKGLSEKLNRLKLRPATALQRRCADKLAARGYVAERVGPEILPRLILATRALRRVSPRHIPDARFVLKANHSWGGVLVCTDRERFDWVAARRALAHQCAYDNWLRHREPVYRGIRPCAMAEELLESEDGGPLADYKLFCFGGQPEFVMHIAEAGGRRTKTMYDLEWRRLPFARAGTPTAAADAPPPRGLARMIEVAAALSAPFAFCRVDLYQTTRGVTFGEITFFPQGGLAVFEPPCWERRLGELLVLEDDGARGAGEAPGDAR